MSAASCSNQDVQSKPILTSDHLYFDYLFLADEGKDSVTLRLEFKQNSRSRGLLLGDSARVDLDGEELLPDSTKYSGVFYEAIRPRAGFSGRHVISFTGADGKQFQQEFDFLPFALEAELPQKISRKSFIININNPDTALKTIQLIMVDTSFKSPDVNDDVFSRNGQLLVTENMLKKLVNGPIIFELHSEKLLPLTIKSRKSGKMGLYYSLNREFELTD